MSEDGATHHPQEDDEMAKIDGGQVIARALKCHPAVLVFPGWDIKKESAA